jgi:hypothetical protein
MYNEQDFDDKMAEWMLRHRYTDDSTTNAKIAARVRSYGFSFISVSAFERAALELINEGEIEPFSGNVFEQPGPADPIPADVRAFIESPRTSAFELRKRYAADKNFRKFYDLHTDLKLKEQITQEDGEELTPESFRLMSTATARHRYKTDARFRATFDRLSAEVII